MNFRKAALLLFSGLGLASVANYSAQVGTLRKRKGIFQEKPFWVIAHRGFSGKFPENTMLAFEQAAALPIDAIELDVHSTRDGKVVVIHDPTLDRTTDRVGRVLDFSWDELKKIDAGYSFDPEKKQLYPFRGRGIGIPQLEDVFQRFPNMKFVVEIKQTLPAIEELVYGLIRKYQMQENVIVASEHYEPLARFRNLDPGIATNLASIEAMEFYRLFRFHVSSFYKAHGDALQIPPKYGDVQIVTRSFVQACRRKGFILHIWTVNDPAEMARLMDCGVDGIISDFPDRLLEVYGNRSAKVR